MCEDQNTDLLVVTENGFSNKNIHLCQIPNYKLANVYCRHHSKGGGVAIFLKQNFSFSTFSIQETVERDFEAVGIKLQSNNSKIFVIGIYRSPSGIEEIFFSKFESLLTYLTNHQKDFVLMGDFNINAMDNKHPNTIRFVDLLKSFGLELLINTPTRVTATTQSAIDNIISNLPNVAVSVVNTAISDHYGQEAIICGKQIKREPKITKTVRDIRPENIALLNISLSKENWNFLNLTQSVEQQFQTFNDVLNFHLNKCCPTKTTRVCHKKTNNKWITKGILISRGKLKFFSEINKKTSSEKFKIFFKKYKKTYKKVIQAAKTYDVSKSILSSKNVSKTIWDIINNKENHCKTFKINIGDKLVSDAEEVADEFNRFFASVACESNPRPIQPQVNPTRRQSPVSSLALAPVIEEELDRIIQQLPSKKSNDLNFMSMWLIKRCSKHMLRPLTQLVNMSFQQGVFPSLLKTAKVSPIFKKDDPCSTNNYRPVSILPIWSKIFEKLFLTRMLQFLNKHNLLSEEQFGFRKGKSTIDAVVSLVDLVVEGLEGRNATLGVFLDLSKAFDCVDHEILLQKLESHGIRGVPHLWLRSFLSYRTQVVQIADQLSKPIQLSHGVPQGSILSPILFLIYVNDIGSSLRHGKMVQYADDTTLCFSEKSKSVLEERTFVEINNCVQNFNSLNLKTNTSKSNVMNFALRSADSECGPAVMLADSILEEVCSSKFLGIHLDRGLTWNNHIDHVCAKLSSSIYVLRSLAKYCPNQVLMTAYYGLIYPHLSYGVVLWGACANNQMMRVFKLQKQAIRIIAHLNFRESCRETFKKLQLLTLPGLYILETTLFCMSKCAMTRGRDIHSYETRSRENYRTGKHRTVVYERLPSQAGVQFLNKLPNWIKNAPTPKAVKTRLKRFLASEAFYNVNEFLAFDWETAHSGD